METLPKAGLTSLQRSDREAYKGAKVFFYLFNSVSLALLFYYTLQASFEKIAACLATLTVYLINTHLYRKCNNTPTSVRSDFLSVLSSEDALFSYPPYHQCAHCNAKRPYRVKHCNKCGECIHRYDHHCFWIGNCVGEQNHHYFYLFLVTQTLLNIVSTIMCSEQMGLAGVYLALSGLFLIGLGFTLFTGFLLVHHTFLILTAQTTWEQMRRPSISYLKHLPVGYNPFSQGVLLNAISFFSGDHSPKEWRVPSIEQAPSLDPGFNICENKYYSCC